MQEKKLCWQSAGITGFREGDTSPGAKEICEVLLLSRLTSE